MVPLGKRFQLARKRQNITLEQASKALRIRPEFLLALESGDYSGLPASAYALGFVGNYAQYLGMPKKETLAMFRREYDEKKIYSVLPDGFTKTEFKVKRIRVQQAVFFILGLFLLIGAYILYQYRFAFISPPLVVYSPKENEIIPTTEITVTGKTDPHATVSVNNSPVSLDSNGNFTKRIDLFEGKTQIQVSASNRFGKKVIIQRRVDVKL